MLYKGMVSKSKYWISGKIRVMSTQKRRKNPNARELVLCQVPLETIMRVHMVKRGATESGWVQNIHALWFLRVPDTKPVLEHKGIFGVYEYSSH